VALLFAGSEAATSWTDHQSDTVINDGFEQKDAALLAGSIYDSSRSQSELALDLWDPIDPDDRSSSGGCFNHPSSESKQPPANQPKFFNQH